MGGILLICPSGDAAVVIYYSKSVAKHDNTCLLMRIPCFSHLYFFFPFAMPFSLVDALLFTIYFDCSIAVFWSLGSWYWRFNALLSNKEKTFFVVSELKPWAFDSDSGLDCVTFYFLPTIRSAETTLAFICILLPSQTKTNSIKFYNICGIFQNYRNA